MNSKNKSEIWGGRFISKPAEIMEKINSSIDVDKIIYDQDIRCSIAHAKMLKEQNIISENDYQQILLGMNQIKEDIENNNFDFIRSLEDIHMNIESALFKIIGQPAYKLHSARSRNDQVVTSFKLWVRENIDVLNYKIINFIEIIANKAKKFNDVVMPGFTHFQIAQPVTFGHYLLAYAEMLLRDLGRLQDARKRLNECPLGSGALAGTSLPIDRFITCSQLGFDNPTNNSLDAVSDRDFCLEYMSFASICSMHLSRMCEELIVWSCDRFNFLKLSDQYSTGSSMMPQKRNPDSLELIRSKAGLIIGSFNSLIMIMKSLPLAYSKDMQEDKALLFSVADNLTISLDVISEIIDKIIINEEAMRETAEMGFSLATDLAEWLVYNLQIPFRESHHIVGKIVKLAENKKCKQLSDLSLENMRSIDERIDDQIFAILNVDSSVRNKLSFGGTAPKNVIMQADLVLNKLNVLKKNVK